jgi:hypothetical protein
MMASSTPFAMEPEIELSGIGNLTTDFTLALAIANVYRHEQSSKYLHLHSAYSFPIGRVKGGLRRLDWKRYPEKNLSSYERIG